MIPGSRWIIKDEMSKTYEALDLSNAAKITKVIEKFKRKHPSIPLG